MLKSLEQERARYAWDCINEVIAQKNIEGKYSSYVKRAPTLIQTNGLGNTLAFYSSKKKDEPAYRLLYQHIDCWFKKKGHSDQDIFEWIISEDTSSLNTFQVTKEILALLNWMKRFAEAKLEGEESE